MGPLGFERVQVERQRTTEIVAPARCVAQLAPASNALFDWEAGGVSDRVFLGGRDELASRVSVASALGATLDVRVGVLEGMKSSLGWSRVRGV